MNRALSVTQGILQLVVGLSASVSGALLMLAPSGAFLRMPPELLAGSPFRDFLVPGMILFVVVGVCQIVAGVLTLRRHPAAPVAGMVFGLGLVIWIFVQASMIGGGHLLQYSYFALGVAETALAFLIQRSPSRTD
ncbi:MAG TPA: hypothetical protein VN300_02515 [Desulfobacterales bacterium]|nr:hypothetical protein [Desulfobacterales bacterium]